MTSDPQFRYAGSELGLFAKAVNWKAYWASHVGALLGPRVLDVGAGLGATVKMLCGPQHTRWLALEPDAEMAAMLARDAAAGLLPGACEVRAGMIGDLGASEQFDTILYIDVLEHIEADQAELERAAGHLAPDGHIIILSPAHQWLYTPFDRALGHFRRYDRATLTAATPNTLKIERIFYLDSAGMLASMGNRFALNAAHPTEQQILLWDRVLVRTSQLVDPLLRYRVGKSIVGVWRKRAT